MRLYLILAVVVFMLGLVVDSLEGIFFPAAGSVIGLQILGVSMVALALWLLRYDIARRTVRETGLTRYVAVCLLSGLLLGYLFRGSSPAQGSREMFGIDTGRPTFASVCAAK